MPRFDPAQYNPADDSTPTEHRDGYDGDNTQLTIVYREPGSCQCGCGTPVGRKSRFSQGHDAKLRGKLTRAQLAQTPVTTVKISDGSHHANTWNAYQAAQYLGGDHMADAVRNAKATPARQPRKTAAPRSAPLNHAAGTAQTVVSTAKRKPQPTGPQIGQTYWVKTGIGTVYHAGRLVMFDPIRNHAELEYTGKDGQTRQHIMELSSLGNAIGGEA